MRSTGSFYRVRLPDGSIIDATLRGKMRLDEGIKSTNPVAVGDNVSLDLDGGAPVILDVEDRRNYILRRSTRAHSQTQILCANIDQAIIVFTLAKPHTPMSYVDNFLVMAEAYRIPAVVVFNKVDVLDKPLLKEKLLDFRGIYKMAGYETLSVSATDSQYREIVQDLLRDKVSFLSGTSGAGKSSLVNLADPNLNLRTRPLARHSDKGMHTTTYAEMHPLSMGGAVIDAPGFKEFEITGIERHELSHYFPEMRKLLGQCRYNNCTHTNEPDCAVLTALEQGTIPHTRYNTYLGMLDRLSEDKVDGRW